MFSDYLDFLVVSWSSKCGNFASLFRIFIYFRICFKHQKLQMFIRSLKLNRPLTLKSQSVFQENMLNQIITTCHQLENPLVFTAIYLLAFFSFLRLSNIVPHSTSTYDVSRHLACGDIIFGNDLAIIVVKWSKTNQFRDKVARISIPALSGSPLCPVTALRLLLQAVPGVPYDLLFTIFKQGSYIPLTDSMVRKNFKRITHMLHWQNLKFTFHSFRRSGAPWAYQHGVPIYLFIYLFIRTSDSTQVTILN